MMTCLPRLSRTLVYTLALLGAPAAALATPIAATVDLKIGEALLANSGDATELAALQSITGVKSLVLSSKIEMDKNGIAKPADGLASAWVLSDLAKPGYFALKFGIGKLDVTADTFFFQNIGDLTQLVWTNAQVQYLSGGPCDDNQNKCNIGRLSHYITSPAIPLTSGQGSGDQVGSGSVGGVASDSPAGIRLENGAQQGSSQERRDVPEPAGIALLAIGALAAAGARRRAR